MPLSGTPAPNKRNKPSKIIVDLSHISQDVDQEDVDPEAAEFDLGTKIKVPKDLMLEELSLLNNRGSKMFRMRQQRVERFVYENKSEPSTESTENLVNLGTANGGQANADGHVQNDVESEAQGKESGEGAVENGQEGGQNGVDGEGGTEEKEVEETKAKAEHTRTYISPWERAMKGNEELTATMKVQMPGPHVEQEPPSFKSFNRMAMPFGGFQKASQLMTFQMPEIELLPEEPEPTMVFHRDVSSRPSFNRTPIGWVCSGEHSDIIMEHLDAIPFDGETDEL